MNPFSLLFDDVHYRYPGGREALRGVSLRIAPGEKVALVGANGAGKSTLLLHTDGLLLPSSGRVAVDGVELTPRTVRAVRRSVGLVFQNSDDQLFMPTVGEDVAFGPANMRMATDEIERRVTAALEAVDALHLRNVPPFRLSGGEKKRAAIATVLAMEPSVLVLDEPTAGLDPRARRRIIGLLRRFGHTTLLATHDMELAAELCPRTVVLDGGRVAADDSTGRIFADGELLDRCGLEAPRRILPCPASGR